MKGEHTWPKILIATLAGSVATVVAAVVGASQDVNIFNGIAPVPTTTVTATATATATETVTEPAPDASVPVATATTAAADGAAIWHRTVHMPHDFGLDVDDTGPVVKHYDSLADLIADSSNENRPLIRLAVGSRAGTLASGTALTRAKCRDAIDTAATSSPVAMTDGTIACVLTGSDAASRLAAVRVVKWDKVGHDMSVDVTVWAG